MKRQAIAKHRCRSSVRFFEKHSADTDENRSVYYARLILIELKNCIPIALACVPEKLY